MPDEEHRTEIHVEQDERGPRRWQTSCICGWKTDPSVWPEKVKAAAWDHDQGGQLTVWDLGGQIGS